MFLTPAATTFCCSLPPPLPPDPLCPDTKVWAATLAHYLRALLEEAGAILPVTARTFGASGEGLPVLVANHAVTCFLQGSVLLAGASLSLLLTRKIGAKPWLVLTPQCLTVLGMTAELWWLIVR